MKKIGVVSKVEYDMLGIENIYNKTVVYVSNLFITIFNEEDKTLKKIYIESEACDYNSNNNSILYLGDVVEYDTELKKVTKVKYLTNGEVNEIELIQKKYINRIEILKEKDFSSALAKCSNIDEVKQIYPLKKASEFEQRMDIIRIKNILIGMSENLRQIKIVEPKIVVSQLDDKILNIIITRLEDETKKLYETIKECGCINEEELNRLLTFYMEYKFYEAIANSRNMEYGNKVLNFKEVKQFLTENDMLPIKTKKSKMINLK